MRWLVLLAIVGGVAACKAEAFACAGDGECMLAGEPGVCVAGSCAYPDDACPSGYRYAAGLDSAFAGECVADIGGTESDGGGATTSESASVGMSTTSVDPSTTEASSSTTDAVDPTPAMPTTSMTSSGPPDDTGMAVDSTPMTASDSTNGMTSCAEDSCEACVQCVLTDGQACSEAFANCSKLAGCLAGAACMESCAVMGLCLDDCCEDLEPDGAAALLELYACERDACVTTCMDFNEPPCGP